MILIEGYTLGEVDSSQILNFCIRADAFYNNLEFEEFHTFEKEDTMSPPSML